MQISTGNEARPHIVMTLFGRCGSLFVHSLIDDHPQVSTIPGYTAHYVVQETVRTPAASVATPEELTAFIARRFDGYLNDPVAQAHAGLDKLGEDGKESVTLDIAAFSGHLLPALQARAELPLPLRISEAIHEAFDLTVSGNRKPIVFYHAHDAKPELLQNVLSGFPSRKILLLTREPLDNVESCANFVLSVSRKKISKLQVFYMTLKGLFDCQANVSGVNGPGSLVVRLEDIKRQPAAMMDILCLATGIPASPTLFQSTFMGKKYFSLPTPRNPGIQGFTQPGAAPLGYRLTVRDKAFFAACFRNISAFLQYDIQDCATPSDMTAIMNGRILDVELELARADGMTANDLKNSSDPVAFRQYLHGIPNLAQGTPCHIGGRLLLPDDAAT